MILNLKTILKIMKLKIFRIIPLKIVGKKIGKKKNQIKIFYDKLKKIQNSLKKIINLNILLYFEKTIKMENYKPLQNTKRTYCES